MLKWLKKIFSSSKIEEPQEGFEPWLTVEISEEKIRHLIRVRIRYVGNVAPNSPDLSCLLREMAYNDHQKQIMRQIWAEEVQDYLVALRREEGMASAY